MTYETIPARVTVVGRIDAGDGRPDLIRSEYPAEFTPLEQGFALAYDESEPPAHVTLTCREGYALIDFITGNNGSKQFLAALMQNLGGYYGGADNAG